MITCICYLQSSSPSILPILTSALLLYFSFSHSLPQVFCWSSNFSMSPNHTSAPPSPKPSPILQCHQIELSHSIMNIFVALLLAQVITSPYFVEGVHPDPRSELHPTIFVFVSVSVSVSVFVFVFVFVVFSK